MNGKAKLLGYLALTVILALGAFALFAGCRKETPTTGAQAAAPMKHETTSMPMKHETASASAQPAVRTTEQTNCPVMGGPIDKSIFVEYKGKKVYFCCTGCIAAFQKEPEKYIAKLPQFAQ
jgi:YHS domain-containing protein